MCKYGKDAHEDKGTSHKGQARVSNVAAKAKQECSLPMMPFRGVLSSCDTMDMNSSLACMLTLRSSICFNLQQKAQICHGNSFQQPTCVKDAGRS